MLILSCRENSLSSGRAKTVSLSNWLFHCPSFFSTALARIAISLKFLIYIFRQQHFMIDITATFTPIKNLSRLFIHYFASCIISTTITGITTRFSTYHLYSCKLNCHYYTLNVISIFKLLSSFFPEKATLLLSVYCVYHYSSNECYNIITTPKNTRAICVYLDRTFSFLLVWWATG